MSFFEKPSRLSRSNEGSASSASVTPSDLMKSSPRVQRLAANLMSKAEASPASSAAILSSVKPFALSVSWLTPGAPFSVARPTA